MFSSKACTACVIKATVYSTLNRCSEAHLTEQLAASDLCRAWLADLSGSTLSFDANLGACHESKVAYSRGDSV